MVESRMEDVYIAELSPVIEKAYSQGKLPEIKEEIEKFYNMYASDFVDSVYLCDMTKRYMVEFRDGSVIDAEHFLCDDDVVYQRMSKTITNKRVFLRSTNSWYFVHHCFVRLSRANKPSASSAIDPNASSQSSASASSTIDPNASSQSSASASSAIDPNASSQSSASASSAIDPLASKSKAQCEITYTNTKTPCRRTTMFSYNIVFAAEGDNKVFDTSDIDFNRIDVRSYPLTDTAIVENSSQIVNYFESSKEEHKWNIIKDYRFSPLNLSEKFNFLYNCSLEMYHCPVIGMHYSFLTFPENACLYKGIDANCKDIREFAPSPCQEGLRCEAWFSNYRISRSLYGSSIAAFRTKRNLRLLNINDEDTMLFLSRCLQARMKHMPEKEASMLKNAWADIEIAIGMGQKGPETGKFQISIAQTRNPRTIRVHDNDFGYEVANLKRRSYCDKDRHMVMLLKLIFPLLDGYFGYPVPTPFHGGMFHSEVCLFDPGSSTIRDVENPIDCKNGSGKDVLDTQEFVKFASAIVSKKDSNVGGGGSQMKGLGDLRQLYKQTVARAGFRRPADEASEKPYNSFSRNYGNLSEYAETLRTFLG